MGLDRITVINNRNEEIPFYTEDTEKFVIIIKRSSMDAAGTESIMVNIPGFNSNAGEDGYFVIADGDNCGGQLCYFNDKEDYEITCKQNIMPIFGVKNKNGTFLCVIGGMQFNFWLTIGVKSGRYYIKPLFVFEGEDVYEDVEIEVYTLNPKDGFVEIAKKYREIQLKKGNCRLIKDKCVRRPELKYAVDSIEIRIRMGWKPAPPAILEQTVENEPEMKVACTFDRVKDFIDELKTAGVDKVQICLVGWNKSGHDGRYPDLFPVEEKLGGEIKLRELIVYAQKNGYQIVCHTNSTDCYSIAKDFSKDIVMKSRTGEVKYNEIPWSGGKMYLLCPVKALEFANRDLPKVAELGFRGLHYIDVMTVLAPRTCYDKNHPVTHKDSIRYFDKIMELCHKEFGGFSSEGCMDFAVRYLDYGLYVTFSENSNPFFDQEIPLWQIVYHGIVMSNPNTSTINCSIKDKHSRDKLFAYGGRPSFYIYSKFLQGSTQDDWLGKDDLTISTDKEMKFAVSKIKEVYDEYKGLAHTQYEVIDNFVITDKEITCVFSDGSKIKRERF